MLGIDRRQRGEVRAPAPRRRAPIAGRSTAYPERPLRENPGTLALGRVTPCHFRADTSFAGTSFGGTSFGAAAFAAFAAVAAAASGDAALAGTALPDTALPDTALPGAGFGDTALADIALADNAVPDIALLATLRNLSFAAVSSADSAPACCAQAS